MAVNECALLAPRAIFEVPTVGFVFFLRKFH